MKGESALGAAKSYTDEHGGSGGSGVTKVNNKTGDVTLYGTDIYIDNSGITPTVGEQICSNKQNIGEVGDRIGLLSDLATTVRDNLVNAINEVVGKFANYILKSDIINNLTTGGTNKPLSAEQGKTLKTLADTKIDTAGAGLTKSSTTLKHSNSITAQTTEKIGKIKYDAQGHITSFTELKLYYHNLYVVSSGSTLQCGFVINTSSTAFTTATFAKWLYDNGFKSMALVYTGATGENTNISRYTATTSGGSPTSQTTIITAITGWYSDDGVTLKAKSNWNGWYTITTSFNDKVIEIF